MAFSSNRGRRYSQRRDRRMHPAVILLLSAVAAILVAILIGNILKAVLDEEALHRLQQKKEETTEPQRYQAYLPDLEATPFVLGEDLSSFQNTGAASISINQPSGKILYRSAVTEFYSLEDTPEVLLDEQLSPVSASVSYISGVFYPQAFRETNADLFYAAATRDAALMQEFCRAGGSEILLVGLPIEPENLDRIHTYLAIAKDALPQNALGIAVRFDVATSGSAWEYLPPMLEFADFFALDMQDTYIPSGAADLLKAADYYLTQYDMRLLLSTANVNLLNLPTLARVHDRQVITAPPEVTPEPVDPPPLEEETTTGDLEDSTENGAYG